LAWSENAFLCGCLRFFLQNVIYVLTLLFNHFTLLLLDVPDLRLSLADIRNLNPASQGVRKKLCYSDKKVEFIIRGGRHKVHFSLCYHIENRIEQANFQA
jgi:hypothetical protein